MERDRLRLRSIRAESCSIVLVMYFAPISVPQANVVEAKIQQQAEGGNFLVNVNLHA